MADDVTAEPDLGLAALLRSAHEAGLDLGRGFLQRVYEIEKAYQFDRDRAVSLQTLERAVEEEVTRTSNASAA